MRRPNMLLLLRVSALWFYLLLPTLLCDNLWCFYSPILELEDQFEPIATECPPDEVCSLGDGRYGNHSVLSSRGCMPRKDCAQELKIRLKGIFFTMTYECCDRPYCNSCRGLAAASFYIAVALVTVAVMISS